MMDWNADKETNVPMEVEENQDFVLLTEEIMGDETLHKQEQEKHEKRRKKGKPMLTLFLILGILCALVLYYLFYLSDLVSYFNAYKESKQIQPQYEEDLSEEVSAKAYGWLSKIHGMPLSYEEVRELFGAVSLEVTQTPKEENTGYEKWIAKASYEKCLMQVQKSLEETYRQVLSYRLEAAGYTGELTAEALDQMMQEAYGMDKATYLAEYGPALLPSLEECSARYAGR